MNKILFFALFFALTNCLLKVSECKEENKIEDGYNIFVDINSKEYEYNKEFDWTDDDSFDFKVPLKYSGTITNNNIISIKIENIIPLFINASVVNLEIRGETYGTKTIIADQSDLTEVKAYNYQVYFPFEATITDAQVLTANVKSTQVKANENDVNQKFIKYFGFAYCTGNGTAKIKTTNILAIFNNGNYFTVSKMLLATLALLFF